MASPSSSAENGDQSEFSVEDSSARPASSPHHKMSPRNRALFFVTAWLIVLMPFLFWWTTWFGRRLPDKQITEYLQDEKHPRHIQHALIQLGERMGRHDATAARWYPELIRLASHPVEEVRNTDAWVMGQDTSGIGFHEALLKMLQDSSPLVRGNAALSLVRFHDDSGRAQIVALLQPVHILAPGTGHILDTARVATAIHQGGIIAKLQPSASPASNSTDGESVSEIRSPISGRIHALSAAAGASVAAGAEIAVADPGDEPVREAVRALYLVARAEDLAAIRPYEREPRDIPDRIREQALLADQAIRSRVSQP